MNRRRWRRWLTAGFAVAISALSTSTFASTQVSPGDMQRYCQGEAAVKFDQRPGNISTRPAKHTSGGYFVHGQFPPNASNATAFECRFNADQTFRDVRKSGHSANDHPANAELSGYAALVGTSRDDAEKNLGKLGFKKKKPAGDGHGSFWWNGSTKECVELQGKNGRVKSIVPTSKSRCQ